MLIIIIKARAEALSYQRRVTHHGAIGLETGKGWN